MFTGSNLPESAPPRLRLIGALASIQKLAEARRAEIDAVLDHNIAQHRLLAALGHPR